MSSLGDEDAAAAAADPAVSATPDLAMLLSRSSFGRPRLARANDPVVEGRCLCESPMLREVRNNMRHQRDAWECQSQGCTFPF